MKKEEFIEKLRSENEENDPYEREAENMGRKIGVFSAFVLTILLFVSEYLFSGKHNFALPSILITVLFVENLVKALKIGTFFSVLMTVLCGLLLLGFLSLFYLQTVLGW